MTHNMTRKTIRFLVTSPLVTGALFALTMVLLITFGGPADTVPMKSVSSPFKSVDYSTLPAYSQFQPRDGAGLSFRAYPAKTSKSLGSVTLVHGSSGNSQSLHVIAQRFADSGFDAYALDMRGHGASGLKGQIDYIGQLEHDIEDFTQRIQPKSPRTLLGFSSGGGFVLRFAGGDRQTVFDRYLLISPFLSHEAPTYRHNSGGWVRVGVPRIVAITILNRFGITALNHLVVSKFAVEERSKATLTSEYSFAMLSNFKPQDDYIQNIRAIKQPTAVLVGAADELFYAEQFAATFKAGNPNVSPTLLAGVGHVGMTLDQSAIGQAIQTVKSLGVK